MVEQRVTTSHYPGLHPPVQTSTPQTPFMCYIHDIQLPGVEKGLDLASTLSTHTIGG